MPVRLPALLFLLSMAAGCAKPADTLPAPSLTLAGTYPAGRSTYAVEVGDLNGDLKSDLAAANYQGDTIRAFLGKGDGSFLPRPEIHVTGYHHAVRIFDVSGDKVPDLVVRSDNGKLEAEIVGYSLLIGNGKGDFSPTIPRMDPRRGEPLFDWKGKGFLSADLDGDGIADRIRESDSMRILLNPFSKNGGVDVYLAAGKKLRKVGTYETGEWPKGITAGDLNSDGKMDIVTANYASNSLSILLGLGKGRFEKEPDLPTGDRPTDVAISDLNGDGRMDLAVTSWGEGSVRIYLQGVR